MNDASFLVLFLAITAVMALVPFLFRRIGVPSVIALLVVGMLLGDTGIGFNAIPRLSHAVAFLAAPGADSAQTARIFQEFVDKLGSLGLMFLMALAGMEADFKLLRTCRRPVFLLSVLTFLLPALAGFILYRRHFPDAISGQVLYASLFASHSVGIVFPVIRELRLSQTRFGASVLIATVITDIASIVLLAVAVQLFRQDAGIAHNVLTSGNLSLFDHMAADLGPGFVLVFIAVVLLFMGATILGTHFFGRLLRRRFNLGEDILITFILLAILLSALVGELFGINFIVGSFIAGLGLSRIMREQDMLLFRRFESIGYGFLIPFLFVSIGMTTDFRAFLMPGSFGIVALTVLLLVGTKVGSGYLAMRASGFRSRPALAAGLMTVPQLSATLTAAAIGKNLGILDPQFFNAIIILSIVTTLPVPSLVRRVVQRSADPAFETGPSADFEVPDVVREEELL